MKDGTCMLYVFYRYEVSRNFIRRLHEQNIGRGVTHKSKQQSCPLNICKYNAWVNSLTLPSHANSDQNEKWYGKTVYENFDPVELPPAMNSYQYDTGR